GQLRNGVVSRPPVVAPTSCWAKRCSEPNKTRQQVLAAAAELFATRGYARTSLAQIADAAGVSTETVKANGPKSGLLIGAFDQAFTGSEQYVPIHHRELGAELMALPTERLLPGYVAFVAGANARIARLWSAFVGAAAGDDAVASELDALQERRRADFRASVALFRERGLARRDVDDAELAAALSALVSPEGYLPARGRGGVVDGPLPGLARRRDRAHDPGALRNEVGHRAHNGCHGRGAGAARVARVRQEHAHTCPRRGAAGGRRAARRRRHGRAEPRAPAPGAVVRAREPARRLAELPRRGTPHQADRPDGRQRRRGGRPRPRRGARRAR